MGRVVESDAEKPPSAHCPGPRSALPRRVTLEMETNTPRSRASAARKSSAHAPSPVVVGLSEARAHGPDGSPTAPYSVPPRYRREGTTRSVLEPQEVRFPAYFGTNPSVDHLFSVTQGQERVEAIFPTGKISKRVSHAKRSVPLQTCLPNEMWANSTRGSSVFCWGPRRLLYDRHNCPVMNGACSSVGTAWRPWAACALGRGARCVLIHLLDTDSAR